MAQRRQLKRESTVDEKEVEALVQRQIQRRADPTQFTDGSLLENLAGEHCKAFRELFRGKRNMPPSPPRTIDRVCVHWVGLGGCGGLLFPASSQRSL